MWLGEYILFPNVAHSGISSAITIRIPAKLLIFVILKLIVLALCGMSEFQKCFILFNQPAGFRHMNLYGGLYFGHITSIHYLGLSTCSDVRFWITHSITILWHLHFGVAHSVTIPWYWKVSSEALLIVVGWVFF